jgi:hypothetical protein
VFFLICLFARLREDFGKPKAQALERLHTCECTPGIFEAHVEQ